MSDSLLEIRNLTKRYGENTVLRDLSFTVRRGEVIVVLGPSGCGKSTLLRCINALEPIQGGEILLGGEVIDRSPAGLPALRRRIGMVFQSYELFPHMTVMEIFCWRHVRHWVPKRRTPRRRPKHCCAG